MRDADRADLTIAIGDDKSALAANGATRLASVKRTKPSGLKKRSRTGVCRAPRPHAASLTLAIKISDGIVNGFSNLPRLQPHNPGRSLPNPHWPMEAWIAWMPKINAAKPRRG